MNTFSGLGQTRNSPRFLEVSEKWCLDWYTVSSRVLTGQSVDRWQCGVVIFDDFSPLRLSTCDQDVVDRGIAAA